MKNEVTNFDANLHKYSAGQGQEMVNFGVHEVKGQVT